MIRSLRSLQPAVKRIVARAGVTSTAQWTPMSVPDLRSTTSVARMSSKCPFLHGATKSAVTSSVESKIDTSLGSTSTATATFTSTPSEPAPPRTVTPDQVAIVKSTVPLLETGGEALTKHFYTLLMKNDVVRPLFNQTHQASGAQPRALAFSVLSYARNIDALENLGPLAAQIVHKHVSFQVMPEHYPIVGECLLRSIRDVLGAEIATDAVIDAWAAAYFQLADILIAAEKKLYDQIANAPGGWRGAREFKVAKKIPASLDGSVMSFELVPKDGGRVIDYLPGQYVGLYLPSPDGKGSARRNYSLSQAADTKSLRITVKKHQGGVASTYLHDKVQVGDSLMVFPPAGEFVLEHAPKKSLVFLTAGVGITPTMAMLQAATASTAPTRPIAFAHYNQHAGVQAFAEDVAEIALTNSNVKLFTALEQGSKVTGPVTLLDGRINKAHLEMILQSVGGAESCDVYVLGPTAFMKEAKSLLLSLGVPRDSIKYEFFGPAEQI